MHVPRNKVTGTKTSHMVKNLPADISEDAEKKWKKECEMPALKKNHGKWSKSHFNLVFK